MGQDMRNQKPYFPDQLRRNAARRWWVCLLLLALAFPALGEALLWRVESPGADVAPSYLFGTMHSDDPRVADPPATVTQALAASRVLLLELDLGAPEIALAPLAMILPPGQTLDGLLDADTYRRAQAAMQARGYPPAAVDRMRPWAVAVTLAMPPVRTGRYLDLVLYEQALAQGLTVQGLERIAEQLGVFEGLSTADQAALLRLSLDEYGREAAAFEALHQAYLARDLDYLVTLSTQAFAKLPPALAETFEAAILTERNRRMAERAAPQLAAGGAFVAVGALHLAGEDGLVARFRARGYRLTPLY
jgi:hypothetical protein